ncbi:hypothetical protein C0J52_08115 [Blattella germanica]|nr:hypothetical protein C0J52_08115 [Blattella germanica]
MTHLIASMVIRRSRRGHVVCVSRSTFIMKNGTSTNGIWPLRKLTVGKYYADNFLTHPTKELCKAVGEAARALEEIMPQVAHLPGVRKLVAEAIKGAVNFNWVGKSCMDHQVPIINGIVQGICAISIPWWCKRRNRSFVSGNGI